MGAAKPVSAPARATLAAFKRVLRRLIAASSDETISEQSDQRDQQLNEQDIDQRQQILEQDPEQRQQIYDLEHRQGQQRPGGYSEQHQLQPVTGRVHDDLEKDDRRQQRPHVQSNRRTGRRDPATVSDYEIGARLLGVLVPLLLLLVVAYASWVFIALVSIDTLVTAHHPAHSHARGGGWALFAVYLFLLVYALSFAAAIAAVPRSAQMVDRSLYNLEIAQQHEAFNCDELGRPRICATCGLMRPDRAHHAREISACILKQDHYCPFIGGNVCFTTQKLFVQFLTAAFAYCLFTAAATSSVLAIADAKHWKPRLRGCWISVIALSAFFGCTLLGMALGHWRFVLENTNSFEAQTTRSYLMSVKATDGSDKRAVIATRQGDHPWDLGWHRNFLQIMGPNILYWLLPLKFNCGSGYHFEFNPVLLPQWQAAAMKIITKEREREMN